MHEYIEFNHHRIGGVFTVTVYCVLCSAHRTITEHNLSTEQYEQVLRIFLQASTFNGVETNAKANTTTKPE